MEAKRIEELDRIEQELSRELIPSTGKAETLGGELLRAIERMIYRYYNDGDVVTKGYGIATCMSSLLYLDDKFKQIKPELNVRENVSEAAEKELNFDYSENDKYNDVLYRLLDFIICFIRYNEIAKMPNEDDSRNWKEDIVKDCYRKYQEEKEFEDELNDGWEDEWEYDEELED